MAKRIIDYKRVDITDEEYSYYQQIVNEFSDGVYSGSEQFRDTFEVDNDGLIYLIKPPLKKATPWVVIVFLQNLMINQRLRKIEDLVLEITNGRDD